MNKKVVLLGAGLSGLFLAKRLKESGFTVQVLEARDRIGGRIYTKKSALETPVEMGATWFGKDHTHLMKLLDELNIGYFEQFMTGAAVFEAFSMAPPQFFEMPKDSPSYRIRGGTSAIIDSLAQNLTENELLLNHPVHRIQFSEQGLHIHANQTIFDADYVISTLPPSLFSHSIACEPSLPNHVASITTHTHTWMQDSIKAAVIYSHPFWRTATISGTVFSQVGPFSELYDQCDASLSHFALCGFINGSYSYLSREALIEKIRTQLNRVFGDEALQYERIEITNWSQEEFTKHANQQLLDLYPHQNNGHAVFQSSYLHNRLFFAGTETSSEFSGYMEGAIRSVERVVHQLITQMK